MENIKELFLGDIDLPQENMREHVDRDELFELVEDIKKNGLINPITVRPKNNRYELVAGQRRYLAHLHGKILKIKCVVRELSDEEALAIMTSENLSRVEVNPVDEAKHVTRLVEANDGDIKKVCHIVGRGEKWVRDRLAIGEMPDYLQEFLARKEIKIGVALILQQITNEELRHMWTLQAVRDGVSVPMAEYWLTDFKRRLLPGGELAPNDQGETLFAPPDAVMFTCSIDGQRYDTRFMRSILIYEGNVEIFKQFVSAFNEEPSEI
jgi:ParB family chromosome partitioning protein